MISLKVISLISTLIVASLVLQGYGQEDLSDANLVYVTKTDGNIMFCLAAKGKKTELDPTFMVDETKICDQKFTRYSVYVWEGKGEKAENGTFFDKGYLNETFSGNTSSFDPNSLKGFPVNIYYNGFGGVEIHLRYVVRIITEMTEEQYLKGVRATLNLDGVRKDLTA